MAESEHDGLLPRPVHRSFGLGDQAGKLVRHNNLCCPIESSYELGIEATYWGAEPTDLPEPAETAEPDPAEMWAWMWVFLAIGSDHLQAPQ